MSAPTAQEPLFDPQNGTATDFFQEYMNALPVGIAPKLNVPLLHGCRGTPVFLKYLATISTVSPNARADLADPVNGRATPFFQKFLDALP